MVSCPQAVGPRWARVAGAAVLVAAGLLWGAAVAGAAEVETRDFVVSVDGKPAGHAQMTINKQDDGSTVMSCDTDIRVKVLLITYTYSYRGREVWKDGRVARFNSTSNDDGKRFDVAAAAEGDKLRLKVNNHERVVRGDVWLSSYWQQPDDKLINQVVPILEADTGRELEARVLDAGQQQLAVVGQAQVVRHIKLQGKVVIDLWYDPSGRLVRQEWLEEGHKTLLELEHLRR